MWVVLFVLFVVLCNQGFTVGFQITRSKRQQQWKRLASDFHTEDILVDDELLGGTAATTTTTTTSFGRRRRRRDIVLGGMPALAGTVLLSFLSIPAEPCRGLSPQDAAKDYDTYAPTYNELDGGQAASILGIDEAREQLLRQARGDVLEIGVGTGLNLDFYDPVKITSLTLVDISDGMLREAERRYLGLKDLQDVPVKFVNADATSQLATNFESSSFDTVVDTFSLCVFGNEGAKNGLDQLKAVVKNESNGGQVLLLENSRSSNPLLGMYQDATADAAASMGGKGCVYNQDVGRLLRESKMKIKKEEQFAAGIFRSFVCTV